jgi:hypothetical protein
LGKEKTVIKEVTFMKKLVFVTLCLFAAVFAVPVLASPALPVTKPPLAPVPTYTGPQGDPHAIQGQWFRDAEGPSETVRPYEFYDNKYEYGGSASKSTLAIEGYVRNITYAQGKITGFGIRATITNDDAESYGSWLEVGNSHGEYTDTRQRYTCNMYQTKLTVEFADDGIQGNLPSGGVYLPEQNIFAKNYDELGWYCWTPNNPDPNKIPWGGYIVPTYDFNDIMHGQSVTRDLGFGLYSAAGPEDALYQFLVAAADMNNGWDVFANRTTSLKISQYIENLVRDDGSPYPVPPLGSSDVSVFFIPEPTTMVLLALGGLLLRRPK